MCLRTTKSPFSAASHIASAGHLLRRLHLGRRPSPPTTSLRRGEPSALRGLSRRAPCSAHLVGVFHEVSPAPLRPVVAADQPPPRPQAMASVFLKLGPAPAHASSSRPCGAFQFLSRLELMERRAWRVVVAILRARCSGKRNGKVLTAALAFIPCPQNPSASATNSNTPHRPPPRALTAARRSRLCTGHSTSLTAARAALQTDHLTAARPPGRGRPRRRGRHRRGRAGTAPGRPSRRRPVCVAVRGDGGWGA